MENRNRIKSENPNLKMTEITKQLGKEWRLLNDNDKEKFIKLSQNDKKRYEKEITNYKKN